MKVRLMHRERDFIPTEERAGPETALIEDLGLEKLFAVMSRGDQHLTQVARQGMTSSLTDLGEITYRQAVMRDCLTHPEAVRDLFEIAVSATMRPKRIWTARSGSPSLALAQANRILNALLEDMRKLRTLADESAGQFESEGLRRFFATVVEELDDAYLDRVEEHVKRLGSQDRVLISARLGDGNKGRDYALVRPKHEPRGPARISTVFGRFAADDSFEVEPNDDAGALALLDLRDRGLVRVAEAASQAAQHVVDFFSALVTEVGFYVCALNLRDELQGRGQPICIPEALPAGEPNLTATGLYDPGLALRSGEPITGNDLDASGCSLLVVTGANQGGKSTFLRSVGLAQLMMQAGLFVAAESFTADLRSGIFTHFKRQEDRGMRSGKLDEELARLSDLVGAMRPGGLILFNESFAATNEREGSEIAGQVTRALLASGIKVFHVTHMYELARDLERSQTHNPLFLRAERAEDGSRTFRLIEAPPLPTSFGEDIYRRVFSG